MKTKEEVIREAWGEYYDDVKNMLTENGYIRSVDLAHITFYGSREIITYNDIGCRPKSLKGIEDNNGWISIK